MHVDVGVTSDLLLGCWFHGLPRVVELHYSIWMLPVLCRPSFLKIMKSKLFFLV